MITLIKANLHSFSRCKVLWTCLLIELLYIIFMLTMEGWLVGDYVEDLCANDYAFFVMDIISFFTAIITCTVVGTDYNDGTIRNKLIAGYSRTQIYLAGFLTAGILSVVNYVLVLAAGMGLVYPFFGEPSISIQKHIPMLLFGILSIIVAGSVYHFISIMVKGKGHAIILCMAVGFASMMVTTFTSNAYVEELLPENYTLRELPPSIRINILGLGDDPAIEQEEWYQEKLKTREIDLDAEVHNDSYIKEPIRTILVFMSDALPSCQIDHAVDGKLFDDYHYCPFHNIDHASLLFIINVCSILLFNVSGCLLFRRMKLK